MAEDPIRRYSSAIEELGKATNEVKGIQKIICEVGNSLQQPYELMVSNVSVEFPPEVAMAGSIATLNANDWPNAKQIAQVLSNLHKKRSEVVNIWHSLSEADKKLVHSPPPR